MFIVNVEGTIFKENKWLIIKRSEKEEHAGGLLSLVGGKVENEGNSSDILEATVKREIFEEVGIEVKENIRYVHSTSFIADSGETVIDIVFLCEYASGEPFAKSPNEVEVVKWMTVSEIMSDTYSPIYLKESIKRAENLIIRK
ncbi:MULTISPECIES: NUDIX hydrolase [Pontibacillus]|uniref:NUDIX domain-containing protein n=1 Tax=Pontibacillus chungwhensis TaxID=265426 RepID=A0ABY8V1R1_9BACI|nr:MULTISPECIES: NUDIX domain-containing protein [Pontibacillus]MCD5324513.1 NUDIX domain-containing protein [Pontibacillus sp. HN14]WIF99192.1 NUDIX domain-containing protein [Pontibacillus chungwhensis]